MGAPLLVMTWEQWDAMFEGCEPPTADDCCTTRDGEVLDTPMKLMRFLARVNVERAAFGADAH
jgi:hypothetical protein